MRFRFLVIIPFLAGSVDASASIFDSIKDFFYPPYNIYYSSKMGENIHEKTEGAFKEFDTQDEEKRLERQFFKKIEKNATFGKQFLKYSKKCMAPAFTKGKTGFLHLQARLKTDEKKDNYAIRAYGYVDLECMKKFTPLDAPFKYEILGVHRFPEKFDSLVLHAEPIEKPHDE